MIKSNFRILLISRKNPVEGKESPEGIHGLFLVLSMSIDIQERTK